MTRMPASRSMIFRLTLSQPVSTPAIAPAAVAMAVARKGSYPREMSVAATAPPSGKEPSTVRSGKSRRTSSISTGSPCFEVAPGKNDGPVWTITGTPRSTQRA